MIAILSRARVLLPIGKRQGFRRRKFLAYNGVMSMLRAKAMMAALKVELRPLARNTTKTTATSVSATYITIQPPAIEFRDPMIARPVRRVVYGGHNPCDFFSTCCSLGWR
jgi:hypothetical protein